MTPKLCLAQDPEADALLATSPFALLTGMLLDQQVTIRWKPWQSNLLSARWSGRVSL